MPLWFCYYTRLYGYRLTLAILHYVQRVATQRLHPAKPKPTSNADTFRPSYPNTYTRSDSHIHTDLGTDAYTYAHPNTNFYPTANTHIYPNTFG